MKDFGVNRKQIHILAVQLTSDEYHTEQVTKPLWAN